MLSCVARTFLSWFLALSGYLRFRGETPALVTSMQQAELYAVFSRGPLAVSALPFRSLSLSVDAETRSRLSRSSLTHHSTTVTPFWWSA